MWAAYLLIIGDPSAIIVAGNCLAVIAIGFILAYLVKLLDKVKPSLGSRLSLVPMTAMSGLIFLQIWFWIHGSLLPQITNLQVYQKVMLSFLPVIISIMIIVSWIFWNLDAIKGVKVRK